MERREALGAGTERGARTRVTGLPPEGSLDKGYTVALSFEIVESVGLSTSIT